MRKGAPPKRHYYTNYGEIGCEGCFWTGPCLFANWKCGTCSPCNAAFDSHFIVFVAHVSRQGRNGSCGEILAFFLGKSTCREMSLVLCKVRHGETPWVCRAAFHFYRRQLCLPVQFLKF
jgi:hypothetical protein